MGRETFSPNPGALEMWLHVPERRPHRAALVVLLHGCTQHAVSFATDGGWLALADEAGFAVLAPQQSAANNVNRCFNWFELQDMRRGGGEPASIAAMIAAAVARYDLDPDRVYIAGLSAGGAMTAVMLTTYPELFAGGAILAGLPYGAAVGVGQALQAMRAPCAPSLAELGARLRDGGAAPGPLPPTTIWHGDADRVVDDANGALIAGQWAAAQGLPADPDETSDARGFSRSTWRDGSGAARIELNRVGGLGHGVPLQTRGPHGLGRTAPYMLEAGVNSTREIAAFWGLQTVTGPIAMRPMPAVVEPVDDAIGHDSPAAGGANGLGEQVMAAVAAVPPQVREIIASALKRSGLLR
jgi:poly(hydroxyalkanoate) depolymerase family esterase